MSLTDGERLLVSRLGNVMTDFAEIIGNGHTRDADIAEVVLHIHALQNMVLAQSAARQHPESFRLMGRIIGDDEMYVISDCGCGAKAMVEMKDHLDKLYSVRCTKCNCHLDSYYKTAKEAVERWNV